MSGENKVDSKTKQKRIYRISLLLTRKTKPFICHYMSQKWGISYRQTYRYIRLAEKEWAKYFTDIKRWGMGYYFAKRRELRDKAMRNKDYRLVLETDKDEAKLAGVYPIEKHKLELEGEIKVTETEKNIILKMDDETLDKFIKKLSRTEIDES